MKINITFILFLTGGLLTACNNKKKSDDNYLGKVDSSAIGLIRNRYKEDSALRADTAQPVMPIGMIIDTGINGPYANDSSYVQPKPAPVRDDRDYRPATTEAPPNYY